MKKRRVLGWDRYGAEIHRDDCVSLPTRRTARVLNQSRTEGWLVMQDKDGIAIELPAKLVTKVADAA